MKKNLLILFVVVFMANNIGANENICTSKISADNRDRMLYGLKFGFNYSNVYDSQGEEFRADPKLLLVAGGFFAVPIGRYFGIQPEILFSQKGFQATGKVYGTPYNFTRTSNYIDVPLLIQLKPSEYLTLMAGPQFSYLIKQTDVFTNSNISNVQQEEFRNNNIRKNVLCFIGGFDIIVDHLVIGLRSGWDVQTNLGDGTSIIPRYKNVWYQATVGIIFF